MMLDHGPQHLTGHRPTPPGHEQLVAGLAIKDLVTRSSEIAVNPLAGHLAERNDARLRALASDVNHAVLKRDMGTLERHQLGRAQSARVHQLQDGAVAHAQGFGNIRGHQQPLHLVLAEQLRVPHGLLGADELQRWIRSHAALADRPAEVALERRQPPVRAARLGRLESLDTVAEQIDLGAAVQRAAAEKLDEALQVPPVGGLRVATEPVLDPHRIQEGLNQWIWRWRRRAAALFLGRLVETQGSDSRSNWTAYASCRCPTRRTTSR
mmetsp:Transcript_53264/g.124831  ORF Transcript_53264/g.124831 Transcript_53264/m.124831 type:complete len:267 (-) Transcript_53264:608-1408(-)